ncbi:dienelactone hydrolase [Rhizodiscina lignyota]|uniref:Dienelactone hydrolase n=1 Tax=Rhizodiscina lignyota TaxID=1504668 RepID=A0A9P4IDQ3_9PEZI|nr:dienelactone hydrolase [Rhizodiscina lignyota]
MAEPSPACCARGPVEVKSYEPKGTYVEYAGLKTYQTGPATATKAILLIYDIFGLYPQTIQGADILAYADPKHEFRVFMPDWFGDGAADLAMYPPDTPEKHAYIMAYFDGPAKPEKTINQIPNLVRELKEKNPGLTDWGIMGHCWGGKVVTILAIETSLFKAAAQCHPSLMVAEDAKNVNIPMAVLASGEEDPELMKKFAADLKAGSFLETFHDQVHGWMASKADFNDPRITVEYYRGYSLLVSFFSKHV